MDLTVAELIGNAVLSPESMAVVLVTLFVTKRIVPYWVYEQALDRLNEFEQRGYVLRHDVTKLNSEVERNTADDSTNPIQ